MTMRFRRYASPIGNLLLAGDGNTLAFCLWEDAVDAGLTAHWEEDSSRQSSLLTEACRQLAEYFSGRRSTFDLPLALSGTPFQQLTWQTLRLIPYGETMTYAQLASRMGRQKAARAVGNANHHNPLMIFIPCHRVVTGNGKAGEYAGGMARKAWLLAKEKDSCHTLGQLSAYGV